MVYDLPAIDRQLRKGSRSCDTNQQSRIQWLMRFFNPRAWLVLQLRSHVKKDGTAGSRRAESELEDAVVCYSSFLIFTLLCLSTGNVN
jgi:hypothetical protein